MPHPVYLYRYDISNGMARSMSGFLIGRELEGIWHTSIVVFGHEFYFDGGVGIVREAHPAHTRFGEPYRTEQLGNTERSESAFLLWVQQKTQDGDGNFGPNSYDLLRNNCNHFTQEASRFLLARDIPSDVREMIPMLLSTPLGKMLGPLFGQSPSASGAVGGRTHGGGGGAFSSSSFSPSTSVANATPAHSTPSAVQGLLNTRSSLTEKEEEDLVLTRCMLESNELLGDCADEKGVKMTLEGLELLRRALQNVMDHPRNAKYRSLSTQSETYIKKLKPIEHFGLSNLLSLAGFRMQPQDKANTGKWFLSDTDGSHALLQRVVNAIDEVIENVNLNAAIVMSSKD
ncbi:unnamed protein product [Phytomonas sp. Hart1]|nr:unnamed protein product [Phytomonas sp. Hart1]|eukprot:CCW71463.1 unnamed protein product [Phytomonas sp. isolate Hart1]